MKYNTFLKKLYEAEGRDTKLGAFATIKIKDPDDEVEEGFVGAETKVEVNMNVTAAVIIKQDENNTTKVLLIQRAKEDYWPNYWEFPRGKCDKPVGESLFKCLKREVKEETGLDVTPKFLIDTFIYLADEGKRKSTCYNFLSIMNNPDQKIKLSKEHQTYKWISEVGEAEMLLLPDQKKTIEKVLNFDRSIVSYPENDFTKNNEIEESNNKELYSSIEYNRYIKAQEKAEKIIDNKWEKDRQRKCHPIEGKSIDIRRKMRKYTGDKSWIDVDTRSKKIPKELRMLYRKFKIMDKICTEKVIMNQEAEEIKWIQANIKLCDKDRFCLKEAKNDIKNTLWSIKHIRGTIVELNRKLKSGNYSDD